MKRSSMWLIGVAIGALVFAAVTPASSGAEQANSSQPAIAQSAASQRTQSGHIIASTRAKPARPQRQTSSAQNARVQAPQWSIKDALPNNSSAFDSRDSDPKIKNTIGRIPLQSGSLGFETETKIKSTEYPDGQRVPGVDTNPRQPPSYLGLSLSLPTSDKSLLPPLFGRQD